MVKELKRSLTLQGHRTSLSLEPEFWTALQNAAKAHGVAVAKLVAMIDADRGERNLSSAVRVHILKMLQSEATTVESGVGPVR
jgi:predicted DNA-binding ribbon-helix-helix protein